MSCSSSRVAVCLPCLRLQSACFLIGYHSVQHDSFADGMLSFTWCPSHPLPTCTAGFLDIKYFRISNFPDRLPSRTGRLKSLLTHNPENHQMIWPQEGGGGDYLAACSPHPLHAYIHCSLFFASTNTIYPEANRPTSPLQQTLCALLFHIYYTRCTICSTHKA